MLAWKYKNKIESKSDDEVGISKSIFSIACWKTAGSVDVATVGAVMNKNKS